MDSSSSKDPDGAREIQGSGWRQCSVFRLPENLKAYLPIYLMLKPDEWLVVCTQSCSVCSENFKDEGLLEVIVATPLTRFNKSHESAKGRTTHTFHLPIAGLVGVEALECHMGRRAFIPRQRLRGWRPSSASVPEKASEDAFKGWLAHYYMRISLPDELVRRLREDGGIRETVLAALAKTNNGKPVSKGVSSFHIYYDPNEDIGPHDFYEIDLVIVCDDVETQEILNRELADLTGLTSAEKPLSVQGVIIQSLKIEPADNVTLSDLQGLSRFNEWDDLSTMAERLQLMRAAV